jgi:IS605 OrfB family transposase
MLLTAKGKLVSTQEQKEKLLRTIQVVNQARNYISEVAFAHRLANKVKLQRIVYEEVRRRFSLPAQHTVRAIASVVNSYKAKKKGRWERKIEFDTFSAIDLDQRLLSFKGIDRASINTIEGRIILPVLWGEYFREKVAFRRGHAKLVYDRHKDEFYLFVAVELPERTLAEPERVLGVDAGVRYIAVDSLGNFYGEEVARKRLHLRKKRQELQEKLSRKKKEKKDTRSVRRALKRLARKEKNFVRTKTHEIAKRVVTFAKALSLAIVLENLKEARKRITANSKGKTLRYLLSSWNYRLLQSFISYKAKLEGVRVVFVEPHGTSTTCPVCGHSDRGNRRSQSEFECKACGFRENADLVGAINISFRGALSTALMPGALAHGQAPCSIAWSG